MPASELRVILQVRQSPTNVFLASLATADLLLILICLPLKVSPGWILILPVLLLLSFRWGSCSPMCGSLAGSSVNWLITRRLSQSSARSSTSRRSVWRGEGWSGQTQHNDLYSIYWINFKLTDISLSSLDQTLQYTATHTVLVLMRFTTIKQGLSYKFIPI